MKFYSSINVDSACWVDLQRAKAMVREFGKPKLPPWANRHERRKAASASRKRS